MKWEKSKPMKGKAMFATAKAMKGKPNGGMVMGMARAGMKVMPSKRR